MAAEVRTHKQWPLAWLKKGPGKETLETPGSTQPVPRPFIAEANQQINLLMTPEMQGIIAALLEVLTPYPEAREAVARTLAGPTAPKVIG